MANENMSVEPFTKFAKRTAQGNLNTSNTQYGLCLKTYNSDLYQNWINTEWIEGVTGINEASAVDVQDGKLSMDALNLAQKVYNFLNRIAVSGGTYRDWLETVYTGGNYMERCETPMFEGGVSQEIEFIEQAPTVYVIGQTSVNIEAIHQYLDSIGEEWNQVGAQAFPLIKLTSPNYTEDELKEMQRQLEEEARRDRNRPIILAGDIELHRLLS